MYPSLSFLSSYFLFEQQIYLVSPQNERKSHHDPSAMLFFPLLSTVSSPSIESGSMLEGEGLAVRERFDGAAG